MEERDYIKNYMKELELIDALSEEDNKKLIISASSGDEEARARLVEGNLYLVPLRVSEFLESNVNVSDLIQEGNIALMDAIRALYESDDDYKVQNYTEYFSELIDIALNAFIAEESEAAMAANNMKDQANRLLDITTKFEEEYDRAATLPELANLMGLEEEEVENILKTSYNAMKLADGNNEK